MGDLVSILMATYNGERFLAPQIESLFGQTHGNFELLAIDDGSSDLTATVLAEYAARDARLRLVPSSGNRGQRHRLAELLPLARGEYISIADQDDVWDAEKTSRLLKGIGDRALAFGRSDLVDQDGKPLGSTLLASLNVAPSADDRLIALFRPAISGHALLARRHVVTDAAFRRMHAYDWLIGLDALFSGGWSYVDDAVVRHRLHGANQWNWGHLQQDGAGPAVSLPARIIRAARRIVPSRGTTWRAHRRRSFVQRIEHLACSPVVPAEVRRMSQRLWDICTATWLRGGMFSSVGDRHVRAAMIDHLQPEAGSATEWQQVVREIERLT